MLSNVYGQKTEQKPDHLWPAVILATIVLLGPSLIDTLNRRFNEINFVLKRMQK